MEREIVVLAMHGSPPRDFPRPQMSEFFGLAARLRQASGEDKAALEARHRVLEETMRAWPRTETNDPYNAAATRLAGQLALVTGSEVLVGYNEFCAPSLDQALDDAAARAEAVTVVTPMMTRGGDHAEVEIPDAITAAGTRHPGVRFRYAWPFDTAEIAAFLAGQIRRLPG